MNVPNIIPFMAITNVLNSYRSNYRRPSYVQGPRKVSDEIDYTGRVSDIFARCSCNHGDPEFDPFEEIEIPEPSDFDNVDELTFSEDCDMIFADSPKKENNKEPPYNLLFEIYRLGLTHGVGCLGGHSENIQRITSEMNKLAKKFGYHGYEDFDRYFDENENPIKKEN